MGVAAVIVPTAVLVLPTAWLLPKAAFDDAPWELRGALAVAMGVALGEPLAHRIPTGLSTPMLPALAAIGVAGAIALAAPLWIGRQVGATATLFGTPWAAREERASALTLLTSMVVASSWLSRGGVARAALLLLHLAAPTGDASRLGVGAAWLLAARAITSVLALGVGVSAGVIVAALALETVLVAIGRVAGEAIVGPLAVVTRPVVAIVALAASLDVVASVALR